MKITRLTFLLIYAVLLCAPLLCMRFARADGLDLPAFDQTALAPSTIALEATIDGLLMVDKIQTERLHAHHMTEANPFLGPSPGQAKIRNYFLGIAILHAAITYMLPPDYRIAWQSATLGLEVGVISINYSNNLGL